jgi:cytochrome c peroxidase
MTRNSLCLAGALLLACGSASAVGDAAASAEQAQMAAGGGMGGGGMGGGMAMDEHCMELMGGGMGGGGMMGGGGGMGGGSDLAMLGRMLFCDKNLSEPVGQSCASCHSPATGFTGPSADVNRTTVVYPGAAHTASVPKFGNRKPPSAAYATPSPVLRYDADEKVFVGGLFWDGRATGWRLGSPAAEQALGPFLNPVEQALPTAAETVRRVCAAMYGQMFRRMFGPTICAPSQVQAAYDKIGLAVAAFEDSPMVNRYGSRYDRYLRGEGTLTSLERKGLALFEGKAKCASCHPSRPGAGGEPPIFTDNTFDNLGLPPNPSNPVYAALGANWVDPGLGGFLATPATTNPEYAALAGESFGKQRVPTLRNVDKRPSPAFVKAYGHNGVFKSLEEIVHYYNTRDVLPACETARTEKFGKTCWPAPEVRDNLNTEELGNLRLTEHDEDAIVAFLKTLSDD